MTNYITSLIVYYYYSYSYSKLGINTFHNCVFYLVIYCEILCLKYVWGECGVRELVEILGIDIGIQNFPIVKIGI